MPETAADSSLPTPPALSFSLRQLLQTDLHLTAGVITELGDDEPAFLVASLDRRVYCLTADGRIRWRARQEGPVYALATVDGGRIAVGDDSGTVALLDARGRRLWQYRLGSRVTGLAGPWQGGLLAGGWDERLTLLDSGTESPRVRWQADLGSPVSGIAMLPGSAVVATTDGRVRAFDASGVELWRIDSGSPVVRLGVIDGGPSPSAKTEGEGNEGLAAGSQEAAEVAILAGVRDGRLVALGSDGAPRWQAGFGQGAAGSPVWEVARLTANADPVIVAGTGGSAPRLALLSLKGEQLWAQTLDSPVGAVSTLDLDDDGEMEILAGLASGAILTFDARGHRRGAAQAGLPVWAMVSSRQAGSPGVLVLADVLAWRLTDGATTAVKPRLPPPAMADLPDDSSELPAGAAAEGAGGEVVLAFLGDVALGRSVERQLERYGPTYPWAGLSPLLSGADLAVVNLEATLTTLGSPRNKPYIIRAHPYWGRTLVAGGVDLVTLANNHTLDFGDPGLDEMLSTLAALGVAGVGAGDTQAEARRPALFVLSGVRVAVLAYAGAYWKGSEDIPATDRIAWADPQVIDTDVRAVRDQADFVVVVLHAGKEYTTKPSGSQIAAAHAAIDAGADLVVGHHPHVIQAVERYRDGLIVYSLGDAVFDIPQPATMRGELLRVHVTGSGLVQAELWPFWIDQAIRPRLLDDGDGAPRFSVIYP